jgi:hypothetical protein
MSHVNNLWHVGLGALVHSLPAGWSELHVYRRWRHVLNRLWIVSHLGAERERRAKVIAAEGEYQAAQRLVDAAAIMAKEPIALHLRFLQTLVEVAAENNSTTIFPVPIDILKPLLRRAGGRTT